MTDSEPLRANAVHWLEMLCNVNYVTCRFASPMSCLSLQVFDPSGISNFLSYLPGKIAELTRFIGRMLQVTA